MHLEADFLSYTIFDAHCDTLTELIEKNEDLADFSGMINAKMFDCYNGFVQIFAAWVNPKEENPLLVPVALADKFYEECEKNNLTHITDKKTLIDAIENKKNGAILSIEGGSALCGNIRCLLPLYRLGYRALGLVWNDENEICGSAADSNDVGLKPFGYEVVKKMNRLGMAVDVSHASDKTFWDTISASEKPIIASHSNARSICAHSRNLTDEQIKAIASCGGVIGLNLYTLFLNGTDEAQIGDVIRHAEHILSLGGEDCLGLGTDFDGISTAPVNLESADKLSALFDEFKRLGYSDELIQKITHENFYRVFKEILV